MCWQISNKPIKFGKVWRDLTKFSENWFAIAYISLPKVYSFNFITKIILN